jgi:molybdate transport system permease protein
LKERGKENSSPRILPRGETLASGLAVAALALVAGFISLPILSLVVWTISENSWRAMGSPVARDALL